MTQTFTAGQSWVAPNGVVYVVVGTIRNGLEIQVSNRRGLVTASADPWLWTERRFRNLIAADGLKLYDPSSKIDKLAERLEVVGKTELAAELDEISHEYVEARQPKKVDRERMQEAAEQIEVLKQHMLEETNPDTITQIEQEIRDYMNVLEPETKILKPTPAIPVPNPVWRPEKVSAPSHVSVSNKKTSRRSRKKA
jgi:hypothetical protein